MKTKDWMKENKVPDTTVPGPNGPTLLSTILDKFGAEKSIYELYEYNEWFRRYIAPYGKRSDVRRFIYYKHRQP